MIDEKTLTLTVAGLALFLVGVFAGHFTAPTRIVESKTHSETTIKLQTIEQKVDLDELKKLIQDIVAKQAKDVHTTKTVEKKPDGTTTVTTTTDDKTVTETASHIEATDATKVEATTNTKILDKELKVDTQFKIVERPAAQHWSVGVLAGYQAIGAAPSFNLIPTYNRFVGGISIDHKLFGPVWGGGFGTSSGLFGLSLRLVW